MTMSQLRIGISGWRYAPWRGTFYPQDLPQRRELEYAASNLNSIEINGSFYSLQRPESYQQWYQQTPEDFVFSVKGGRFITHMRRLKDVEIPLANFFASGLLRLKEKLGPILWQLPPSFRFEPERIESFLKLLPRDTHAAGKLAQKHDPRMKGRSWTRPEHDGEIRHAMEVRHESFLDRRFVKLLREMGVALVVADTAQKWPYAEDVTADFFYIRMHGDKEIYVSGYTDKALDAWAKRIDLWRQGKQPADRRVIDPDFIPRQCKRDIYAYFDNDVKVRAPYDAMNLAARLTGKKPKPPPKLKVTEEARTSWPASPKRPRVRAKAQREQRGGQM